MYDGLDLIAELEADNDVIASYMHGPGIDDPLIMRYDGYDYFYHKNHLGSVVAMTDISQNIVKEYEYDAFGNILNETGSLSHSPFTYTGREYHAPSGLYYYRARFYDPAIGRFITQDPIGHLGGINLYAYVGNDPVMFVDPFGLLVILTGGGASVTFGFGAEASVAHVIHINRHMGLDSIGYTGSVGSSRGFNVSTDAYIGYIEGGIANVSGKTGNVNLVGGPISLTLFFSENGKYIGLTLGYGPGIPFGLSGSQSHTGTLTFGEIFNFWASQFKKLLPCS